MLNLLTLLILTFKVCLEQNILFKNIVNKQMKLEVHLEPKKCGKSYIFK